MTSCRPFRPHAAERCRAPGLLELVTRYLQPGRWSVETTGSPTFLGNPHGALALLSDPGRTDASGHAMRRRGPRSVHHEGSRIRTFEAQSHGFGTGCLRFAGRVTPTPRKTRFRLLARLFRTGLLTRRVPSKGFTMYPTLILLSQVQRSARTVYSLAWMPTEAFRPNKIRKVTSGRSALDVGFVPKSTAPYPKMNCSRFRPSQGTLTSVLSKSAARRKGL
jgi:hypothetical protein